MKAAREDAQTAREDARPAREETQAAREEAARERGYWVSTANIDAADPDSITDGIAHLSAQSIEGLVVIAPQMRVFRALTSQRIDVPYVTLQSAVLGPEHTLSVDQIAGARMATRHLMV